VRHRGGARGVLALLPLAAHRGYLLAGSPARIARAIYGMNPFPESLVIAQWIAQNSQPEDRVLIVGSEPQILFYARRSSATRYMYFYPLTGEFPDARERRGVTRRPTRGRRTCGRGDLASGRRSDR
jgi:hypothetical protein